MLLRDRLSLSVLPAILDSTKNFYHSVLASLGTGFLASLWKIALLNWIAVMILTPIILWLGGENLFPTMAILGVIAQVTVVLFSLLITLPISRVVTIAASVLITTWGVEALGSATDFPFGDYAYTSKLQPQTGGVPWLIPLAWLMMLPPAWAVTASLIEGLRLSHQQKTRLIFSGIAGLAFTVWDFYLDPQMVAHGLWVWETPGGYFGIPWVNFVGWWLASAVLTWLFRPTQLSRPPLITIYTLTWAFQAIGLGLFWGQPGPALVGFLGMGIFVISSLYVELHR